MFLVNDNIGQRHKRIERFFDSEDAPIAILLAAADFERTVRRALLALGTSPTKQIKQKWLGKNFHGPDAFKVAWRAEVTPRFGCGLASTVKKWDMLKKAYVHRHRLIHGGTGRMTKPFATSVARTFLGASSDIHNFAAARQLDLDRTIRRYKAWHSPRAGATRPRS